MIDQGIVNNFIPKRIAIVPMLDLLWRGKSRYLFQELIYLLLGKAIGGWQIDSSSKCILTHIVQVREQVGLGYPENARDQALLEILVSS